MMVILLNWSLDRVVSFVFLNLLSYAKKKKVENEASYSPLEDVILFSILKRIRVYEVGICLFLYTVYRHDNFHDKNHENIGYNYYTKTICPLARRLRFYLLLIPI